MSNATPQGLLDYYNAELAYLRQAGGEFAEAHPKVASRLQLGAHECPDPQVERLIESFAFLTARLQRSLDHEVPGISSALLEVLYPNYLTPVPPMTVAELVPDAKLLGAGYTLPAQTPLFAETGQGDVCRFRTGYPVTLHPLQVSQVTLESAATYPFLRAVPRAVQTVRVRLEPVGAVPMAEVNPSTLRFYLGGEMSTGTVLYELLFAQLLGVALLPNGQVPEGGPRMLDRSALSPVGLGADEGILPCPATAHPAYRLLHEYFTIPRKLLFFDLDGVGDHGATECLDLLFVLDRRAPDRLAVNAQNFRLGCTPVVNLFERLSEPVRVDQHQVEYRLVPDARRESTTEIHSVLELSAAPDAWGGAPVFEPFYSYTHEMDPGQRTFWHARRRPSERADLPGSDVMLSFLDLRGQKMPPPVQTVWARVLCTNRRLAAQLLPGDRLQLEQAAPVTAVRVLHPPTPPVEPPLGAQTQWRLVSHLSLNHLSLAGADPEASLYALREILRLYAAWGDPTAEAQVGGLRKLAATAAVRRVGTEPWTGFSRGTRVELMMDESAYDGGSALLLAMVLDRFFALYASVNSWTQLTVRRLSVEGVW
ncbi:MAG TPA: type VI secretion system baseplate subunit TssF, partial [Longimicrobium sp.]|nr:type VI secretion system baseplate subunit TssF [Longimicrobium sp.]